VVWKFTSELVLLDGRPLLQLHTLLTISWWPVVGVVAVKLGVVAVLVD
jgi:hypothetical protein